MKAELHTDISCLYQITSCKFRRGQSVRHNILAPYQRYPVADLSGITILGLGGISNPRFLVPEGHLLQEKDFADFYELTKIFAKRNPLLFTTHSPKKYSSNSGLDHIKSGINVGEDILTKIRRNIGSKFAVSGHIHEAYGIIDPETETPLNQTQFYDKLDFNPGAAYDHLQRPNLKPAAGILEFKDGKARARIINL